MGTALPSVPLASHCSGRIERRLWLLKPLPVMGVVCPHRFINFGWSLKYQCRNPEMEMSKS